MACAAFKIKTISIALKTGSTENLIAPYYFWAQKNFAPLVRDEVNRLRGTTLFCPVCEAQDTLLTCNGVIPFRPNCALLSVEPLRSELQRLFSSRAFSQRHDLSEKNCKSDA